MQEAYDVIIVGAGPAGLSAALILGRCRRSVLICDTGKPRNAASHALHGYLTRDGTPPREFLDDRPARAPNVQHRRDDIDWCRGRRVHTWRTIQGRAGRREGGLRAQASDRHGRRRQRSRHRRIQGARTDAACSTVRTATAGKCAISRLPSTAAGPAALDCRSNSRPGAPISSFALTDPPRSMKRDERGWSETASPSARSG